MTFDNLRVGHVYTVDFHDASFELIGQSAILVNVSNYTMKWLWLDGPLIGQITDGAVMLMWMDLPLRESTELNSS